VLYVQTNCGVKGFSKKTLLGGPLRYCYKPILIDEPLCHVWVHKV
jgi:hypothetical protein